MANDRPALGHALHAKGEDDRQHRRQAFRNGRHRQADCGQQHVLCAVPPQQHAKGKGQQRQGKNAQGQVASKLSHIDQQRRLQANHVFQHVADLAQLGLLGRGHHHARSAAGIHQGAGIGHAAAVGQAGRGGYGVVVFIHG